jgi:predicted nuclease with TOPRIM domain
MSSLAEGQLTFESSSDFHQLEEKIYRTIELLKAARAQKAAVEQESHRLRERLEAQTAENETLRRQIESIQAERGGLRERVEKLLAEVDLVLES